MSDGLADLAQWATEVVYSFGYIGVFVLTTLANLHLPLPSELFLPLAGFLVGQGRFSFALVLAASTAGGVIAALVHYFPGLWIGDERLRQLFRRIEKYKLLSVSDLDRASKAFERHGGKAIVLGHLIPGVGALISLPAGIKRMPLLREFMVYTIVGSALWNIIFIGLGWALGANWALVERYAATIKYVVLVAVVLGTLWFLWRRWKELRSAARQRKL